MTTATPIAMLYLDDLHMTQRGYTPIPDKWDYNPTTQVSSLIEMGGSSEPTTRCMIDSTGTFSSDSDEANDDKGAD